MKKRPLLLLPLIVIAAGLVYYFKFARPAVDDGHLRLSGNIEVTEAQLSFKIAGRMQQRLVQEGDAVVAGQPLARLDSQDQQLAVRQAEANLTLAQAVLAELQAGSRPQEIETARAELARAEAAAQTALANERQAAADHQRYQALVAAGGVSQRQFESQRTALTAASNASEEARARVKAAREQLALRQAGTRQESIDGAAAKVAAAAAALDQARQQQSYTELLAPFAGVVLTTPAEAGEYLNPSSPVVSLGELDKPWLRAYLNERDLGRVRLGQTVAVSTDSYPGKTYPGRISFISGQAEFTPKSVQTFEERVKLMYRVKIELDNPEQQLKPGMPADARIELSAR